MKKAVDFQNTRVQAADSSTSVDNQLVTELLLSNLSGKEVGDLVEVPLPKHRLLKIEILEEGLYSGIIVDAESNDILHEITKQTFKQVVDNIVAKSIKLQKLNNDFEKEQKESIIKEAIKEASENKESDRNITININITKAIEDFMSDLQKSISVEQAVKMILTDKMQVQDVLPKVAEEKRDDVLKQLRKKEAKKSIVDEVYDIVKAKYIKREGTPGNYKYVYSDTKKDVYPEDKGKLSPEAKKHADLSQKHYELAAEAEDKGDQEKYKMHREKMQFHKKEAEKLMSKDKEQPKHPAGRGHDWSNTKQEIENALKNDMKSLEKINQDIEKLKQGKKVENLSMQGALKTKQGLEAVIANKKQSLKEGKYKKSAHENENMEQNAELKDLVKSILSELPQTINEDALIKAYEKAKTVLEPKQAVQLIKSIVDKKYPKQVKKSEDKKLFTVGEDNEVIAKSVEALKEIGNDIVDFSSWDDDLTEQQEIIKSNIQTHIKEK